MKNLFPILGDHRYSPRVKTILGKPVLLANQRDQKPSPQVQFLFKRKILFLTKNLFRYLADTYNSAYKLMNIYGK